MPVIAQRTLAELVQEGVALLDHMSKARRGGFYVSQKMLTDKVASTHGLVLKPELAAAMFSQVTSLCCEYDMSLADFPIDTCRDIAHHIKPHGIVAIQTFPSLIARFSDARDQVQFRLMLGVV